MASVSSSSAISSATPLLFQTTNAYVSEGVITGKLFFGDSHFEAVDRRVSLYAQDRFGRETHLYSGRTKYDGSFKAKYNAHACWWHKFAGVPKLILKVTDHHPVLSDAHNCLKIFRQPVILQMVDLNLDATNTRQDFGQVNLTFNEIPVPFDQVGAVPATLTQTASYDFRLIKAAIVELAKKAFISLPLIRSAITPAFTQKIFNFSFTKYEKSPLSCEALIHELKNEICATDYVQDEKSVTWTANWDKYSFSVNANGQTNTIPNVTVIADKTDRDTVVLREITIQIRDKAPVTITSNSAPQDLKNAIYIARNVFCIKGEASIHLAEGHLLPGIVADNFFKFITPNNPLYALIAPFLAALPSINKAGSMGIIFNTGSIMNSSALSSASATESIVDAIKQKADFINDVPPEPIDATHVRAKHAKGFYDLYLTFMRDFIKENVAELNKPKYLKQIFEWSMGVMAKSSVFPKIIEQNQDFTDPQNQERLARYLANVLSKVSFLHWSAHSRQQLLTHADQAIIGMRIFDFHEGMKLEDFAGASVNDIALQLSLARTLLNFKDLSLLENPLKNLNLNLLNRIKDYTERFPNDYDWKDMSIGTAI